MDKLCRPNTPLVVGFKAVRRTEQNLCLVELKADTRHVKLLHVKSDQKSKWMRYSKLKYQKLAHVNITVQYIHKIKLHMKQHHHIYEHRSLLVLG